MDTFILLAVDSYKINVHYFRKKIYDELTIFWLAFCEADKLDTWIDEFKMLIVAFYTYSTIVGCYLDILKGWMTDTRLHSINWNIYERFGLVLLIFKFLEISFKIFVGIIHKWCHSLRCHKIFIQMKFLWSGLSYCSRPRV